MKRQQIATLAVLIVTVFSMTATSLAAAQGLPTSNPTNVGNKMDIISLLKPVISDTNGNKLECATTSTGTGTETGSPAGKGEFHLILRGCVGDVDGIEVKCTGLGDANAGEILVLGVYHFIYDTGGTELGVAILFLIGTTHFTCVGLDLDIFEGEQVCLIKEPYLAKTLHEIVCIEEKGVQKETWLNDAGQTITPKLTALEDEETPTGVALSWKALALHLNTSNANVSTLYVMN